MKYLINRGRAKITVGESIDLWPERALPVEDDIFKALGALPTEIDVIDGNSPVIPKVKVAKSASDPSS